MPNKEAAEEHIWDEMDADAEHAWLEHLRKLNCPYEVIEREERTGPPATFVLGFRTGRLKYADAIRRELVEYLMEEWRNDSNWHNNPLELLRAVQDGKIPEWWYEQRKKIEVP